MSCNARSDYIRTDSTDICADHAWADGTEHTDVNLNLPGVEASDALRTQDTHTSLLLF